MGSQKEFLLSGANPAETGFADQQLIEIAEHTLSCGCSIRGNRRMESWQENQF